MQTQIKLYIFPGRAYPLAHIGASGSPSFVRIFFSPERRTTTSGGGGSNTKRSGWGKRLKITLPDPSYTLLTTK